jgi:hypothetical protein
MSWHTTVAVAQAEASPPSASPSADPDVSFVLPTEEQVPNGLEIIQDGERTLEDVASGFSDPDATTDQFTEWGWQGNVVRAFHVPSGAEADPTTIDGIYISVHEFGSPEFAAEALDYAFEAHAADTNLEEIGDEELGDYSRTLYGTVSYGNEVTLYVQQGQYLIRLSASSPTGDPRGEAVALMQTMLEANPS